MLKNSALVTDIYIFAHPRLVTGKFVPDAHGCFTRATETSGLLRKHKDHLSVCTLTYNYM